MGADIHMFIIKQNANNFWNWIKLYRKCPPTQESIKTINDVFKYIVPIEEGRDYLLWQTLKEDVPYKTHIDFTKLDSDLVNIYKECFPKNNVYTGYYNFTIINLADLKCAALQNPKVRDYDAEEEYSDQTGRISDPIWRDSPLIQLERKIETYLKFAGDYYDATPASDVQLIYWFDH